MHPTKPLQNRIAQLLIWASMLSLAPAQSVDDSKPSEANASDTKKPAVEKSAADDPATTPQMNLADFRPEAMLKVAEHNITRAKFPVVDVHTHFSIRFHNSREKLLEHVAMMDRNNIAVSVNLDGELGDQWDRHADYCWQDHKDRFVLFVHLNWQGDGKRDEPDTWDCQRPDFARRMARQLAEAKQRGASGLKVFKMLGLYYPDANGELLKIDDPRWDPIWKACGEIGFPVIIHTADPVAFFRPADKNNERWEELSRHPDWSFHDEKFPSHAELVAARNRVIARHPKTQFIGAHIANYPEDLATVSKWLDQYPNLVVELSSRIGELGRQPYTARDFLIKYADRVMFGTDGPQPELRNRLYFRFLETRDEYFPYSEKPFPPQGFWNIYGVHLPDDVLKKIYHENAIRIIPGVRERLEKAARK